MAAQPSLYLTRSHLFEAPAGPGTFSPSITQKTKTSKPVSTVRAPGRSPGSRPDVQAVGDLERVERGKRARTVVEVAEPLPSCDDEPPLIEPLVVLDLPESLEPRSTAPAATTPSTRMVNSTQNAALRRFTLFVRRSDIGATAGLLERQLVLRELLHTGDEGLAPVESWCDLGV